MALTEAKKDWHKGEKMDFGEDNNEWRGKNYYASDFDSFGRVKKRHGYRDAPREASEAYRKNYDKIFRKKDESTTE